MDLKYAYLVGVVLALTTFPFALQAVEPHYENINSSTLERLDLATHIDGDGHRVLSYRDDFLRKFCDAMSRTTPDGNRVYIEVRYLKYPYRENAPDSDYVNYIFPVDGDYSLTCEYSYPDSSRNTPESATFSSDIMKIVPDEKGYRVEKRNDHFWKLHPQINNRPFTQVKHGEHDFFYAKLVALYEPKSKQPWSETKTKKIKQLVDLMNERKYSQALPLAHSIANSNAGSFMGEYQLGVIYAYGLTVPSDMKMAEKYLKSALEKSQTALDRLEENGPFPGRNDWNNYIMGYYRSIRETLMLVHFQREQYDQAYVLAEKSYSIKATYVMKELMIDDKAGKKDVPKALGYWFEFLIMSEENGHEANSLAKEINKFKTFFDKQPNHIKKKVRCLQGENNRTDGYMLTDSIQKIEGFKSSQDYKNYLEYYGTCYGQGYLFARKVQAMPEVGGDFDYEGPVWFEEPHGKGLLTNSIRTKVNNNTANVTIEGDFYFGEITDGYYDLVWRDEVSGRKLFTYYGQLKRVYDERFPFQLHGRGTKTDHVNGGVQRGRFINGKYIGP